MFGRDAPYESEEEKARRERTERIQKEIDRMSLSEFLVSELPAVLIVKGFRLDPCANGQFLTLVEAENLLEQKLLRAAQDRADRADRVESSISRHKNLCNCV